MATQNDQVAAPEIFPRVYAWETLLAAWHRVEENEGAPGVDGVTLDEFELRLEEHLTTLQRDLTNRTYRPAPLLRAWMPKPTGGKRPLAIPTVRDRVAQCAAALVVTPILEREFEAVSYGFRRGRSVPHAVAEIERHREAGYRWVVDADIDDFFDTVERPRLLDRLKESVPDPDLLRLVEAWITAPVQDGPQLLTPTKGLPQGSPLSPVLANLYLDRFDEALQQKGMKLVRFADDFLILCKERPKAEAALRLTDTLLKELGLSLDLDKTRITHFDQGFRYLGHLFTRSLVLPSPNRLHRSDPLKDERSVPVSPVPSEAPPPETEHPPAPGPRRSSGPFRRTLYIQEQGSVLAREGERLLVKKGEEVLLEVPSGKIDQIFVFGRCALTTPAMTYCLQEEIPIVLLSSRGQYYGLIDSPVGDHVSLHRQQFARAADPSFTLATAKAIVRGKLANSRVLLQRHQRRKRLPEADRAIQELDAIMTRLHSAETLEEAHGYEGTGAARYFEVFGRLLRPELGFTRRVRRPPTDPVNSLLSLGYTLCFYNLYALIRARGLHPYVGHLHVMRDRHPALASDLLEEFRAPVVDSLVLYLVNSKLLGPSDFSRPEGPSGPCLLKDQARKVFLKHFEQKMATPVTHPHTGEAVDWRRAMDLQVTQMVQWIRGEIGGYRPMEIR
jgi:CRISPR-associated protein Cas1